MKLNIPFNSPNIFNNEKSNINKVSILNSYSANGYFTKKCEMFLKQKLKTKEALLVNSCTSALEMCAILLNIKKGDQIIMPSFTFVSSANAFVLRGGVPVFVDIDPKTCNIDVNKIKSSINKKTKAILVVHYAGISCDMESIQRIAKKHKLFVIEDMAHAILSSYKKKPLGSIGDLATLSFHETKNIHCGEGGALLINNPTFINRSKILRDKGTNRDLFNKKIVRKYTWIDIGSSFGLSEINAAFLYAQLIKSYKITKKRKKLFDIYHRELKILEKKNFIKRPTVPNYSDYNGHIYYILVNNNKRQLLINFLKKRNISSVFHYIPLHSSPYGRKKGLTKTVLKNTNNISHTLLRLPLYYKLKNIEVKNICKLIKDFYKKNI